MRHRIGVLHVIDSLGVGGAEQLLVILARHIDRSRFDMQVCSLNAVDPGSPIVDSLRSSGTPIHDVSGFVRHDPRHVMRVAMLVRRMRFGIVHGHLPYGYTVAALAGKLTRRTAVATLHSIHDVAPSRHTWKVAVKHLVLRRWTHSVIACAEEIAVAARTRLNLPDSRLVVLRNPVEDAAFDEIEPSVASATRRELLSGRAGPLVVAIGALLPAKGHEILVAAVPGLLEVFPEARVVIAGRRGSNAAVVHRRMTESGVQDHVLLAGLRRDVRAVLAAADLFVLPSLWEGLPLALLEAMAAGTPVVATRVGGVPEVVADGASGRLVAPGDHEALARAMIDVLSHPDAARNRAVAARAHMHASHGARPWADCLSDIYESLAAHAPSSRQTRVAPFATAGAAPGGTPARGCVVPSGGESLTTARSGFRSLRTIYRDLRLRALRTFGKPREWLGVRILGYHRICDADDELAVSPGRFRDEMRALIASGAQTVRLADALDLLSRPVSGRFACVTFDDGYRDNLDEALPVLRDLKIPATIFVPTRVIDGVETFRWYANPPPSLTWRDIERLQNEGVIDFQSHSRSHPKLPLLDDASARAEIFGSRTDLEARLGRPVTLFCYPSGLYGDREINFVEGAGYRAAVTTRPGINPGGTPLTALRRSMISHDDDLTRFVATLEGMFDRVDPIPRTLRRLGILAPRR
jgi:glycosyltransferase involved in cell wall biosynthesis/peptidoglycan/xylan/chitin deacetylase (PgdA/CDA1 family)